MATRPTGFQLDLARYELRGGDRVVPLERQPMELLILFAQRRGELVTREEIAERFWGKSLMVDADHGINNMVRKLRLALGDDSEQPRFLQTVVGKGYRFIGDLDVVGATPVATPPPPKARTGRLLAPALAFLALGLLAWSQKAALRRILAGESPIRSIVVLPLENMSGDSDRTYFADGMTDELTTDLAKIGSLKVISRTSAMHYRGTREPLSRIASELGVDAVIEGSVTRSGNRVRITAQLIDARHDRHVWAESYDRDLDDVLVVQNSVAREIARQVHIRLTSVEQERLGRPRAVNSAAYDAYLRGVWAQGQQSPEALKEGQVVLQEAIAADPSYAPAYAGLADGYSLLANYRVLSPRNSFPLAEAAARKAVELDATSPEAHTALGYPESHFRWDWEAAEREYKTAIALSPSYATARLRYAEALSCLGRHDEAIAEIRRAQELDPLSPLVLSNVGRFLYHARRYDEAILVLKHTLDLEPTRVYARIHLAMCYEAKRMPEAEGEWDEVKKAFGGEPGPGVAHFYAGNGRGGRAQEIAQALRQQAGDSDWFFIAGVYAALGDKQEAFACLEKAYETHDFFLAFLKVHPYMDPLRGDPRYVDLLQRVHLAP
jgi:TolB-like protein/DNA-binding winged helix-turn-helix (wHTH) protein/Tfp pilus assembly protein PilF